MPFKIYKDGIPYTGHRARGARRLRYTVSGRGNFPTDMLRYDGAIALLSPGDVAGRDLRSVKIERATGCTPERWRSFGWSVHDDIVEE